MNTHQTTEQKLSDHVNKLVQYKAHLQQLQKNAKQCRELLKKEELITQTLMDKMSISECTAGTLQINLVEKDRLPTTSFSKVLPLVQQVFNPQPDKMQEFLKAVEEFKLQHKETVQKLTYKQTNSPALPDTVSPQNALQTYGAKATEDHEQHTVQSLASAIDSLL